MTKTALYVLTFVLIYGCGARQSQDVKTGAEQTDQYLHLLSGKKIGLFINHTSVINNNPLPDSLANLGLNIIRIFTPEHGFAGNQPDGESIENQKHTKFDIVSLYGKTKRPADSLMTDLDILIIDIQDVGLRCYTYASTMTYLMEACANNDVKVIIFDRPNPNGHMIDGPMLENGFESFVGLHKIPLVHGLTLGELALMIAGEKWLKTEHDCDLTVIKLLNWKHADFYALPVAPSPNLPNDTAIAWYPSLVLFEGTNVSIGRGTNTPFQILGHPAYGSGNVNFTPQQNAASKYPPLENKLCKGIRLDYLPQGDTIQLQYLLNFYNELKGKTEDVFFNKYFEKLAGTDKLRSQIEAGLTADQIRESWQEDLKTFKMKREKYLLYE